MARHFCPDDWSREEFAQRLQDLLELAPTLLPGNSSAHRGPDQVGSDSSALQADAYVPLMYSLTCWLRLRRYMARLA